MISTYFDFRTSVEWSAASRQKAYREIHIIDQSTYNLICHCQNEKCGDSWTYVYVNLYIYLNLLTELIIKICLFISSLKAAFTSFTNSYPCCCQVILLLFPQNWLQQISLRLFNLSSSLEDFIWWNSFKAFCKKNKVNFVCFGLSKRKDWSHLSHEIYA